jgi:transposase IS4-like protein
MSAAIEDDELQESELDITKESVPQDIQQEVARVLAENESEEGESHESEVENVVGEARVLDEAHDEFQFSVHSSESKEELVYKSGVLKLTWDKPTDFTVLKGRKKYTHNPANPSGPKLSPATAGDPMTIFTTFFDKKFMKLLVRNTNKYGMATVRGWKDIDPTTCAELYTFFGYLVLNTILHARSIRNIWNTNPVYDRPALRSFMSRNRFSQILSAFHISDHTSESPDDKNAKVRDMVDHLNIVFKASWVLHKQISFDESSPGSAHRCSLVKRTKNKKVSSALQHWVLADSVAGYCYHFEAIWDTRPSRHVPEPDTVQKLSATHRAVYRSLGTINPVDSQHHSLFADNLFLHPALVHLVHTHLGHYMTGTWRSNYMMPKFLKQPKITVANKRQLREARLKPVLAGECLEHGGGMVGVSFYDTNLVSFLTNDEHAFRKQRGGTKDKVKLEIQHTYNKYMNGVDRLDQLTEGEFSTYVVSRKWWKRIFFWMLDLALANAFTIYVYGRGRRPSRDRFHEEIAMGLFNMGLPPPTLPQKRTRAPRLQKSIPHPLVRSFGQHLAVRRSSGHTNCQYCWKQHQKRKKTVLVCSACAVSLCLDCFAPYHQAA